MAAQGTGGNLEDELEELEEKAAHPIELFFDLVFVFAFTRVVSLVVHDLSWNGVGQGAVIIGLLWWGWGNWTWTLNAVDINRRQVRVAVLVAMLGVFLMGFAVPDAFGDSAMWVAIGYLWVRLVAGVVMWMGTLNDSMEHTAVVTYLPVSLVGPVLMVIGALQGGDAQLWLWLLGMAAEVGSAVFAGRADWRVDAAHFAERHGLIMIIALGEAIIAVGVALGEFTLDLELAYLLAVGLAVVSAMWWAYFDRLQGSWEHALRQADVHDTGSVARDVYSLGHYPMILGIVFMAVALEEAFHHPDEPMKTVVRWLFVGALLLYLGSMAVVTWRCFSRVFLYERLVGLAVIGGVVAGWNTRADRVVLAATAILIVTMVAEYIRFLPYIRGSVTEESSTEVAST
ncbi:MAG: low temperature requirement protein A [Actinomycetota bacterium]